MTDRRSILVVEDDEDLRRIYSTALTLAGFDVHACEDGMTALQFLEIQTPDLVVLDLFLPTVSGFVVQDEIAARVDAQRIPVVIVTAADIDQIEDLDADCVLRKPVMPDQLTETVRRCLVAQRAAAASRK